MRGAQPHPQPCVQSEERTQASHHRRGRYPRHSLRNGFNGVYRALPGVHDLLVTVARRLVTCRLSASPGAPGPHDFSVRSPAVRPTTALRPPHSNPTLVTVAKRPS
jgi:hypothetical protein